MYHYISQKGEIVCNVHEAVRKRVEQGVYVFISSLVLYFASLYP